MPPPPEDPAARLLCVIQSLDLSSADGRAGIRTLLAEIERLSPGAILRQAATIELDRLGWRGRSPTPSRPGSEAPRAGR